ncbi:MAG: hypothetical protein KAH44_29865 [Oricola sp.]|jgi:hypothetical protein|nr:hypothetical protein [Oricola sp.]
MDRNDHSQNKPPADVIRDGSLKATIWENEGEKGPYFTTKLAKTYEDRDGKLRDTDGFSSGDLLRIAELARSAYQRTNELRRDLKQDRQQSFDDLDHEEDQGRNVRREAHRESRSAPEQSNGRTRRGGRLSSHYPEPSR